MAYQGTHKIPNHQQENLKTYRAHMLPDPVYMPIPSLVADAIAPAYQRVNDTFVSEEETQRLAYSQLVYLREYARVIYQDGEAENTPGWVIDYLHTSNRQLESAATDTIAGRKLFSSLEKAMRFAPSNRLSVAILNILKTAYNPDIVLNSIGATGFDIVQDFGRDTRFIPQRDRVRNLVVWAVWGPVWAKAYGEQHQALTPGVYDSEGQEIKEGFVFLARVLVAAGLPKAEVARVLDVSRLSVISWVNS